MTFFYHTINLKKVNNKTPIYVPTAYPTNPITMPLIKTFLFFIAPTIGGINGGEQSSPTWATVNKSPGTFMILEKIIWRITEVNITYNTNNPILKADILML